MVDELERPDARARQMDQRRRRQHRQDGRHQPASSDVARGARNPAA